MTPGTDPITPAASTHPRHPPAASQEARRELRVLAGRASCGIAGYYWAVSPGKNLVDLRKLTGGGHARTWAGVPTTAHPPNAADSRPSRDPFHAGRDLRKAPNFIPRISRGQRPAPAFGGT